MLITINSIYVPGRKNIKSNSLNCSEYFKMSMCLLCRIITTKTLLKTCSTKSLSIHGAIHLHFPSWFSDRGFHHVSLLVHEATQRNNPPLWEMHQSLNLCPTLTAQRGDNGDVRMSLSPSRVSPGKLASVSQEVIKIRG